jgi:hypothetical protein
MEWTLDGGACAEVDSLSPAGVARIYHGVARRLVFAPVEVGAVSGQSVRVGATQDLLALNIELASVMQAGRWKSTRLPMPYRENVLAAQS